MTSTNKEYHLIAQHRANMRRIENELILIKRKTHEMEEKEYDLFAFIRAFQEYIDESISLNGYPPEARQLDGVSDERRQLMMLDIYMDAEIRHTKQQYQAEYEELETMRKRLLKREVQHTSEYQHKLKLLRSGGSA